MKVSKNKLKHNLIPLLIFSLIFHTN